MTASSGPVKAPLYQSHASLGSCSHSMGCGTKYLTRVLFAALPDMLSDKGSSGVKHSKAIHTANQSAVVASRHIFFSRPSAGLAECPAVCSGLAAAEGTGVGGGGEGGGGACASAMPLAMTIL